MGVVRRGEHTVIADAAPREWNVRDQVPARPGVQEAKRIEDGIVAAVCAARAGAIEASLGMTVADGSAVGTNRRHPSGPANPAVPVLMAREVATEYPDINFNECIVDAAAMKLVLDPWGMVKYPTFRATRLWKKWAPWEASTGKPSRLLSTMTFARLTPSHRTGIPRKRSRVPHSPGPMSTQ